MALEARRLALFLQEAQAEELAVVHRQIETLKLQIQEAEEQHHAATLQQKEKEEGLTSQVADLQRQITALQDSLGEAFRISVDGARKGS